MNYEILCGHTTDHLNSLKSDRDDKVILVHHLMINDFKRLQKEASEEGFDLQIISGFRSYERQLSIWNSKARGERVLLDDDQNPLNFNELSPIQLLNAILRWSALPGCSRHHWGSDIDVFDANSQKREDVQLTPQEVLKGGAAFKLHEWLDEKINSSSANGFFRPYALDRGGVAPERWHLSYAPVSHELMNAYSYEVFLKNIEGSQILLKEEVLKHAKSIYERFVKI